MKNDHHIALAIGQAAAVAGSNGELADATGIHRATIGKYRNGRIQEISDDHWEALYPAIRRFLPNHPRYTPASAWDSRAPVGAHLDAEPTASEAVRKAAELIDLLKDHRPDLVAAFEADISAATKSAIHRLSEKSPPGCCGNQITQAG
jgi:hypothetical protein